MYPYIKIFGINVYMTGLGIVLTILSFLFLMRFYCKRFGLNFRKFFNWVPLLLILPYVLGGYFYSLIEYNLLFPTTFESIRNMISPYGYRFSIIGIIFGILIAVFFFLQTVKMLEEKKKRIDILFYSLSLSFIVFGFFLTLGDNFIGKTTQSFIGVTSFKSDSLVFNQGKVYPIGLFLSFISIISFTFTFFINYVYKKYGLGIFGALLFLFLLNFVIAFQQYPRHLNLNILGLALELKNYVILLSMGLVYYYYFRLKNKE